MEEIRLQVSRARRRLITEQFLTIFAWSMFGCLLVACVAIAVPKMWALGVGGDAWLYGWLGGAVGAGFLVSAIWTYSVRRGELEAAIEIDRRFGLKERVSSTMNLLPTELESQAGQALMADASRRVQRLDIRDKFKMEMNFRPLLPIVPALVVGLLFFLDDASVREAKAAAATQEAAAATVKSATQSLRDKLEAKKKELKKSTELARTAQMLTQLGKGLEKMSSDDKADQKKALVKIDELSKDLEKRRAELGGVEKMRRQLNQLKNIMDGPADKVADAIKDGDFAKAMKSMKSLEDKLANGKMSTAEQKQLAKQLDQLAQKLQQMADKHEQAKQDLQKQIQEKMKAGDRAGAARLKQQLAQMQMQDKQMQQMQQMAQQMAQAAQQMKQGNQQQAAQQMKQMAKQLQQMQNELDELETIDDVMDQIADAKNAMNCKQCNGKGCQACQGSGMGMGMGQGGMGNRQGNGNGMGRGQGRGDRPEEQTDTGKINSRVRGELHKGGEVAKVGETTGPNRAGQSRETVKEEILGSKLQDADPINTQRLPRNQREHLQQYFDGFTDE